MLGRVFDDSEPSFCGTDQLLPQSHFVFRNLPCIAVVKVFGTGLIPQDYGKREYKHRRAGNDPNSYSLFYRGFWHFLFHIDILCIVAISIEKRNKIIYDPLLIYLRRLRRHLSRRARLFAGSIITQIGRGNNISAEIRASRTVEDADPYNFISILMRTSPNVRGLCLYFLIFSAYCLAASSSLFVPQL